MDQQLTPVRMLGRVGTLAAAREQLEPPIRITYGPRAPTSPSYPQNTLRATLQNGLRHVVRTSGLGALAATEPAPLAPGEGIPGPPPADQLGPSTSAPADGFMRCDSTLCKTYEVGSYVGAVSGIYHGYRRNNSLWWALGWMVVGSAFPFVTIPLSVAQGFGKPKGRKPKRRR